MILLKGGEEIFFKKKNKKKELCFHEWKLIDFRSYVDVSLAYEEDYELGCTKCSATKIVDEYVYKQMIDRGLIKKQIEL